MHSLFWLAALKCTSGSIPDLGFEFPEIENVRRIQRAWRRYEQHTHFVMSQLKALLSDRFICKNGQSCSCQKEYNDMFGEDSKYQKFDMRLKLKMNNIFNILKIEYKI